MKNIITIIISFTIVLQINGQEESCVSLVNNYFKKNQYIKGKEKLDECLDDDPTNSDLIFLLGKYYYNSKKYDKARYYLLKTLSLDKNNLDARKVLIGLETQSKKYSSAICYVNELLEYNPYNKEYWQKKIGLYKLQKNFIEARKIQKRLIEIYPNDLKIRKAYVYELGQIATTLRKEQNYQELLPILQEMVSLSPEDPSIRLQLINILMTLGYEDEAMVSVDKALKVFPEDLQLVEKKISMLSEKGQYSKALEELKGYKKNLRKTNNTNAANKKNTFNKLYNHTLLKYAQHQQNSDPYVLHDKVYSSTKNKESLKYLISKSIEKRNYEAALGYIKDAQKRLGETKDLLLKEYNVLLLNGNTGKANAILEKLFLTYPEDFDIRDKFLSYKLNLTKEYLASSRYESAIPILQKIISYNTWHKELSLEYLYQCYMARGNYEKALSTADYLISIKPDMVVYQGKKVNALVSLERYEEALSIYEGMIDNVADENYKLFLISSYEDVAGKYIEKMFFKGNNDGVITLSEKLLVINAESKLAIDSLIKACSEKKDYTKFLEYAQLATATFPDDVKYKNKLAEAYLLVNEYEKSEEVLEPLLIKYPYNKNLRKTYSSLTVLESKKQLKNKEPKEAIQNIDKALNFDKTNSELNLMKSLAFEQLKEYDSAYYYHKFYKPGIYEMDEHKRHAEWLKNKTYKREIGMYFNKHYNEEKSVFSISGVEYNHKLTKHIITGRLDFTGRPKGQGLQTQLEWTYTLNNKSYVVLTGGVGTKYFNKIIGSLSYYRSFNKGIEADLGVGYRKLTDDNSLISLRLGGLKEWEYIRIYSAINASKLEENIFYNLLIKTRFKIFNENKSYIETLGSFGTMPGKELLETDFTGVNIDNTMFGIEGRHMLNSRLSLAILGTWYHYKFNQEIYKNLYSIQLQTNISF